MADIDKINLIPPDVIEQRRGLQDIRRAICALTCLGFCILIVFSVTYRRHRRVELEVSNIISSRDNTKQLEKEVVVKYRNIEELQKRRGVLSGLAGQSYFTPILFNLADSINPDIKLKSLRIAKNEKRKNSAYNLTLSGIARSYLELSIFLSKLQKNISFYDVILQKSNIADQKKSNVNFQLIMNYQRHP